MGKKVQTSKVEYNIIITSPKVGEEFSPICFLFFIFKKHFLVPQRL